MNPTFDLYIEPRRGLWLTLLAGSISIWMLLQVEGLDGTPSRLMAAAAPAELGLRQDLVTAAVNCDLDALDRLWKLAGSDPQAREQAQAALRVSVGLGKVDAARYLLDRGVSPDLRSETGKTPLMILAASPDVAESCRPISLALLDAGADIDATDEQGRTALDISVDCHNTTLTEILRSHQHQGRQLCP